MSRGSKRVRSKVPDEVTNTFKEEMNTSRYGENNTQLPCNSGTLALEGFNLHSTNHQIVAFSASRSPGCSLLTTSCVEPRTTAHPAAKQASSVGTEYSLDK